MMAQAYFAMGDYANAWRLWSPRKITRDELRLRLKTGAP